MKIVCKTTNDLYPDLSALGGVASALPSALHEIGSALTVSEAAELIVAHFPSGCGSAVAGTADDMDRAEQAAPGRGNMQRFQD